MGSDVSSSRYNSPNRQAYIYTVLFGYQYHYTHQHTNCRYIPSSNRLACNATSLVCVSSTEDILAGPNNSGKTKVDGLNTKCILINCIISMKGYVCHEHKLDTN